MSARPVLTAEQIAYIRRVAGLRRRIAGRLRKLPTNAKMAEDFNCSQRVIDRYSSDDAVSPHVPRETQSDERLRARITDESSRN